MFGSEDITRVTPHLLGGTVRRRAFRILVGHGEHAATYRFTEDSLTIGSHEGNGVVLPHPTVSRFHARIELDSLGYLLTDLDSTNGTLMGGMRVKAAFLPTRAALQLGEVHLSFEIEPNETEIALARMDRFGDLLGTSPAMRRLFEVLTRVAPTDATVLIQGETGSGKELVASELHAHSARQSGPYVIVDCASLPETLIEAELFGHERGAFTGAQQARVGAFEKADGGTLFLDEIGEIPLSLQAKLLRALEARTIKRVGSNEWRRVQVRVIAATHRDLPRLCNQRLFREDLYFRLSVVTVQIPPLRERVEDLPLLARAILDEAGAAQAFPLDERIFDAFKRRRWAGNVRELRNVLHRALLFGVETLLDESRADPQASTSETLSASGVLEEPFKVAKAHAIEEFEKRYLSGLLTRWHGNVARAARAAEVDPAWIFRLVKRHGLDLEALRRGRS
jgi:two-component system response regulator GlrR